jgi:hypothetical protein
LMDEYQEYLKKEPKHIECGAGSFFCMILLIIIRVRRITIVRWRISVSISI